MNDLALFDEYREGEGNRLEVKNVNGGLPNSLWDTYSSFSNCNGGAIILGVKEHEDGSWYTTHLQNENKILKDFWDTINNRKKVSVNLLNEGNVDTYEIDGDVIIIIYVPKADRVYKPVYINDDIFGGTFRRDHEGDYQKPKFAACFEIRRKRVRTAGSLSTWILMFSSPKL